MAIVKLSKLKLYGMKEDKDAIVDAIYKSKLVHVKNIVGVNGLSKSSSDSAVLEYDVKMQKVKKVIDYYENLEKKPNFDEILVNENDFENFESKHSEILEEINQINKILEFIEEKNSLIEEIKS